MTKKTIYLVYFFINFCFLGKLLAQEKDTENLIYNDSITANINLLSTELYNYNPLKPSKAAFYSAVLPGLGQIYNGKYWKTPIIYAALGTATYFYVQNNYSYKKYREAYKLRLAGKVDPYKDLLSNDALVSAQKNFKKNRDLSLIVGIGIYALQIVEASINSHLLQFNTSDNLSLKSNFQYDLYNEYSIVGISMNFNF